MMRSLPFCDAGEAGEDTGDYLVERAEERIRMEMSLPPPGVLTFGDWLRYAYDDSLADLWLLVSRTAAGSVQREYQACVDWYLRRYHAYRSRQQWLLDNVPFT